MCLIEALQNRIKHYLPDVEEWKLTRRNGVGLIINAYSLDQFGFYFMDCCEKKINTILLRRQQYTFPNTPKILVFPRRSNQPHLMPHLVLTQNGPYTFEKLISHHYTENTILELFLNLLKIVEMLAKKYGYFTLTSKMIKAIKGPTPLIWINQNVFDNRRQYPIVDLQPKKCQHIMVRNLIDLILSRCQNQKLNSINSQTDSFTFQSTFSILGKLIKSQKMKTYAQNNQIQKKNYKMPIFIRTMKKKKEQKCFSLAKRRVENLSLFDGPREQNKSTKKTAAYPAQNTQFSSSFGSSQYFDGIYSLKTPKTQASQASPSNRTNFQKSFRDTRNTLSTTTNRLSSGNTSLKKTSDGISSSFGFKNNRALLSSFGASEKDVILASKKEYKNSCKFFVKESKIIEENSEEFCIQSPALGSPRGNNLFYSNENSSPFQRKESRAKDSFIKRKESFIGAKESFVGPRQELQKDFSCLFHSTPHDQTLEAQIPIMEQELNRLLLE